MEAGFGDIFFLKVEFYKDFLFRAVFDPATTSFKCSLQLPPGKHSFIFCQACLEYNPDREKSRLKLNRIISQIEKITPCQSELFPNINDLRRNGTMPTERRAETLWKNGKDINYYRNYSVNEQESRRRKPD